MATIESLGNALNSLQNEKERMMAIYTERTGMTREVLEAQMATDDWFGSDKAIELGFVSYVIPAASASSNTKKEKEMKGKKVTVAEAFKMLGIALGITKDAEGLTITTSTGDKLEVERDGGELQVGDEASPDGSHVLEDGRTVVVEGGKIVEIREASEEESEASEEGNEAEASEEVEETNEAVAEVDEKESETETLQNENETLKARIIQLQGEVDALKAAAKSEEETRILEAVSKAGGEEWLTKAAASTYVPAGRSNTANVPEVRESLVEKRLAEARERNKKRFERK
jgi:ATP-dependent Clp protease protease subunit